MKKLILITILVILSFPLCGYTLKGGVTYTVETARKEAFADVEYTLPKAIINANRVDPNFRENKIAINRGLKEISDRYIQHFSDKTYGIIYKNNKSLEYYYSRRGKLLLVGKRTAMGYPWKVYRYDNNGKLKQISFHIVKGQSYIFTSNGKMEAHWINNKCYDNKGKLIMHRY